MSFGEQQAWVSLAAAAQLIQRLQFELRILSNGDENALSDVLKTIDIDVEKLRKAHVEDVITWISAEQCQVSHFVDGNDLVQNDALTKVGCFLNNAKNAFIGQQASHQ